MPRVLQFLLLLLPSLALSAPDGSAIYTKHCASCHGDQGEGVDDEYDEALVGKRSLESLTKYIHKSMPEDEEDLVINEDAQAVAAYIHAAFYSPEAQAKLHPIRQDLLRLSQQQHRRSITDIVQSFRNRPYQGDKQGLQGNYFNKEKMNDRKESSSNVSTLSQPSKSTANTESMASIQKPTPFTGPDPSFRPKPEPIPSA